MGQQRKAKEGLLSSDDEAKHYQEGIARFLGINPEDVIRIRSTTIATTPEVRAVPVKSALGWERWNVDTWEAKEC